MRAEGQPSILCYIVRSIAVPSSLSMPGSIDDVVSSNVCPFKFRIVFVAEQNSPVVVPNTNTHSQRYFQPGQVAQYITKRIRNWQKNRSRRNP